MVEIAYDRPHLVSQKMELGKSESQELGEAIFESAAAISQLRETMK